jgi:hypothetical protein
MPYVKRRAGFFLYMTILAIFLLVVALILLMTRPAWPSTTAGDGLPPGATCEIVREKVAEHGKAVALAWAIKQGFSFAQIRAAKRCLFTK